MKEMFGPITIQVHQPDLRDLDDKDMAVRLDQIFKTVEDVLNKGVLKDQDLEITLRYINVLDAEENPFGEKGLVVIKATREKQCEVSTAS